MPEIICDVVEQSTLSGPLVSGEGKVSLKTCVFSESPGLRIPWETFGHGVPWNLIIRGELFFCFCWHHVEHC